MKTFRIKNTTPKYLQKYKCEKTAADLFMEHATHEDLKQFMQLDIDGMIEAIEPLIEAFQDFNDQWTKYRSEARDLYMSGCMFYGYLTTMQDFAYNYIHDFQGIERAYQSLKEFQRLQLKLSIQKQFKGEKYA